MPRFALLQSRPISLCALLVCAVLSSCGGGSNSGPVVATDTAKEVVAVMLDGVPVGTTSKIHSFHTAIGSFAAAATLVDVPTEQSGLAPVLIASDAGGEMLLATRAASGKAILSAESTAAFMGRVGLAHLLRMGVASNHLDAAILAAPQFPSLTLEIARALTAAMPPIQSPEVLSNVIQLVSQVQTALVPNFKYADSTTTRSIAASPAREKPLGREPRTMPYTLVHASPLDAIILQEDPGKGVLLINQTLLGWGVTTTNLANPTVKTRVTSEGISFWDSAYEVVIGGGQLQKPLAVPGDGMQFTISADMDNRAMAYNVGVIVSDVLGMAFGEIGEKAFKYKPVCAENVMLAVITSTYPTLFTHPTLDNIRRFIQSLFKDPIAIVNTFDKLAECYFDIKLQERATSLITGISRIGLAIDFATATSRVRQFSSWANNRYHSAEICKHGGVVVSCNLVISAPTRYVGPYQTLQLTAIVESRSVGFPDPSQLVWTLSEGATSTSINKNGLLTHNGLTGNVGIKVENQLGDSASYDVVAYSPRPMATASRVLIGQSVKLTLVDPTGAPAILNPAWVWSIHPVDATYATVDPLTGVVVGKERGFARFRATDVAHSLNSEYLSIEVAGSIPTTLLLDASVGTVQTGSPIVFKGTVIRSEASTVAYTSSVKVSDETGTILCAMAISTDGNGECTATFATAGTRAVMGHYEGNNTYAPSDSTGLSIVVMSATAAFWEGTFQVSSPVGCSAAPTHCDLAVNPVGGGSTGTLLAAMGTTEPLNVRKETGVSLCRGYSTPIDANTTSFTLPQDMTGVLLPGPHVASMVFTVTSRTPTLISGTFTENYEYAVFSPDPWTPVAATVSGTWSMRSRATSFPKCTNPPGGMYCTSSGQSLAPNNFVSVCDWQPAAGPGRNGEWLVQPR